MAITETARNAKLQIIVNKLKKAYPATTVFDSTTGLLDQDITTDVSAGTFAALPTNIAMEWNSIISNGVIFNVNYPTTTPLNFTIKANTDAKALMFTDSDGVITGVMALVSIVEGEASRGAGLFLTKITLTLT